MKRHIGVLLRLAYSQPGHLQVHPRDESLLVCSYSACSAWLYCNKCPSLTLISQAVPISCHGAAKHAHAHSAWCVGRGRTHQATRLPAAVLPHQADTGGGEHLAVCSDSLGALPTAP